MLALCRAHRNDAAFGVHDDRGRLPESAAAFNGGAGRLAGRIRIGVCLQGIGDRLGGSLPNTLGQSGGASRGLRGGFFNDGFARSFREDLVCLAQDVLDVLFQRLPELIAGAVFNARVGNVSAPAGGRCAAVARAAGRSGSNLGVGRDRACDITRHIHVIDLVMFQERRIGHDCEVRAIQFEAHVDLFGNPGQQLRQGLVNGIQGDSAGDPGVNVDISLGVAGQGKEQLANRNVIDDNAVGFCLAGCARRRQGQCLLDRGRYVGGCRWCRACCIQVPLQRLARGWRRTGGQQERNERYADETDFHRVLPCLSGVVTGHGISL